MCSNTGGIEDLDREENQIDGRRANDCLCLPQNAAPEIDEGSRG
jgi:hypothetical protein